MRQSIFSRLAGITAAAVIGWTSFCFAGEDVLRDRAYAAQIISEAVSQEQGEPVSVLISLNSDSLLDSGDQDYLETDAADRQAERIRLTQQRAEESIRALYPELTVTRRYSALINGFACKLPESLLEAVRALPLVKYAEPAPDIMVPEMAVASETVGVPAFTEETGSRGEGQVIAVIDSELDLTHPMFAALPDGTETPVTKEDISRLAGAGELSLDIDPDKAYRNSKVPYAVCYTGEEAGYDIAFEKSYHGTHVCGIAAGRPFTAQDGTVLSGVAPDAQLLFFCCGSAFSDGIENTAAMTALEDAVKLKADVINLSFGISGYTPSLIWNDSINAAERLGVTVCVSAGNDDNGTFSGGIQPTVERLDNCRINAIIADDTRALCVGSVENPSDDTLKTILFGDRKIGYTCCAGTATGKEIYLGDTLKENTDYEYVYCGLGMDEIEDEDLTGKIALVDRGVYTFTEKAENAYHHGAVGVIVIQNTDGQPKRMPNDAPIPTAMITKEEGELLKNAEVKTVRFSSEKQTMRHDFAVSSFSSWGVRESLLVRPDIAGIGGSVRSAAYGCSSSVMDGTSMSSPFVAGCAALLNAVLKEQGCTLTGSERAQRLRNLLMSSAVPLRDDGLLTTPRRQGAGLVSAERMIHDSVLLTGDDGECKRSLGGRLEREFSFDVTLTNLSREPVQFSDVSVELTTDGVLAEEVNGVHQIGGQQRIRCTAGCGGLYEPLAAGESRTETVTVIIDQADYAVLTEQFPFGFFVDGFLLLSGADGCCDISMPLVGFAGDWTDPPIIDSNSLISGQSMLYTIDSSQPLSEIISLNAHILEESDLKPASDNLADIVWALQDSMTDEDIAWLRSGSGELFVSPNGDWLADHAGVSFDAYRPWQCSALKLYDASGRLIDTVQNQIQYRLSTSVFDFTTLEDGEYDYEAELIVQDLQEEMTPKPIRFRFTVDRTEPEMSSSVKEENGRKILTLNASDANLDGILVMATGKGGPADSYDSAAAEQYGLKQRAAVMSALSGKAIAIADNSAGQDILSGSLLPVRILNGVFPNDLLDGEMCYFDYLTPENGETAFSAEYDITDFTDYWFVALDRAYNYVSCSKEQSVFTAIGPGRYLGSYGVYDFTETNLTFRSFLDNYPITMDFELDHGTLKLINEPSIYFFHVRNWGEDGLRLSGEFRWAFGFGTNDDVDLLRKLMPQEYGDYTIGFCVCALEKPKLAVIIYDFLEKHYGEIVPFSPVIDFEPNAVAVYHVYPVTDSGEPDTEKEPLLTIRIDFLTGTASLPDGTQQQLFRPFHGDYDGNGEFSIADAILLARYISEEAGIRITHPYDLDGNGMLDSGDLAVMLEYLATYDWEGVMSFD